MSLSRLLLITATYLVVHAITAFAKLVPNRISRVVTMVLGGMLDPLKSAVKFHKEIDRDNFTFKLFYRASYGLCILASTLIGASQYIGDPIECYETGSVDEGVFEDHCWIHGTERIGVGKDNEREIQDHFGCVARVS